MPITIMLFLRRLLYFPSSAFILNFFCKIRDRTRGNRQGAPQIESETSSQPKKPHFFSAVSYSSRHFYAARVVAEHAASIKPTSLVSNKAILSSWCHWRIASEPEVQYKLILVTFFSDCLLFFHCLIDFCF
jgi:hypothetical protein